MRTIAIVLACAVCLALSSFAQTSKSVAPKSGVQKATTASSARTAAPKSSTPEPPGAVASKAASDTDAGPAPKADAAADPDRQALQAMKDLQAKRKQAVELTREWFRRWNALDGKPDSINKLLDLYRPDAVQEVGPNERQLGGGIFYQGQKLIRRSLENYSNQWSALHYLIANRTVKETTVELIQTGETPWGATQVAVEFTGGQTNSKTKKRFMLRGAAFFELQNGKISRIRIYTPREEMVEITGPLSVTM